MATRLTEHLIAHGLLSVEQAAAALESLRTSGGSSDIALFEQVPLTEAELLRAIGEVSGHRTIDLFEFEANREVSDLIPHELAERVGLVPLWVGADAAHLACVYPIPGELQEITSLLKRRIEPWIALEVRIRDWMSALYGTPLSERHAALLDRLNAARVAPVRKRQTTAFSEETTLEHTLRRELLDGKAKPSDAGLILLESFPAARSSPSLDASGADEPVMPNGPPRTAAAGRDASGEPDGQAEPEWTLAQARAALKEAMKDRDEIIQIVLSFARRAFDFAAVFAVLRGAASLWAVRGELADPKHPLSIPIDAASVFRTVCTTRRSYVGPLPPDPLTRKFLEQLGRSPRTIFVFPVEVSGRLVAIVYGDCAQRPMSRRRLSDFLLFCQDLPTAFQELILLRRLDAGIAHPPARSAERPGVPESFSRLVWAVPDDGDELTPVKARAQHHSAPAARFPPDFAALLRTLTGPDPNQRALVLEQLARFPEAAANKLILHFPGPTGWSRLPVFELPHAEELGPIPGALAFLGEPAARALGPLLDSKDPDARYFALLTAGSLAYPELADGILRALFAPEPEISSAARAAASAFRRHPGFEGALKQVRQQLAAPDLLQRSLAARALGVLHDRDSIDGLIGLTGSEDRSCAEAAAEALREITKAPLGPQMREWRSWWAQNRDKSRAEWLVAALDSQDIHQRLSAIQELSNAFHDNLGYFADGPAGEREHAIRRWERLIASSGRTERVEL